MGANARLAKPVRALRHDDVQALGRGTRVVAYSGVLEYSNICIPSVGRSARVTQGGG